MRKRPHWLAIVLWVFAILSAASEAANTLYLMGLGKLIGLNWWNVWLIVRSVLSDALVPAALGALVEMADRIRLSVGHRSGP